MTISIIIPVLNEATCIGNLLTMLTLAPKYVVAEIIVVDGGSTDDTRAVVKGFEMVICLESRVQSRAAQMNVGARAAKGEILYFVHADTLPPAFFYQYIVAAVQGGVGLGCFRYRFRSTSLMLRCNAWFTRFKWLWCQGGDKTLFVERSIFEQLGGYDEYYTIMEEYDFLRRAMLLAQYAVLPYEATVSARKYERNAWLRVQLANATVFSMFRRGATPAEMKQTYETWLNT